jgi:glucosyl-dolichyl phosphate glucuronosyltransferase
VIRESNGPIDSSKLDFSVVLCVYTEDRWLDLLAAMESLHRQTLTPREIIVVVDNNPRLLQRVAAEFPGIVCIPNKQMAGASGARNSGVAVSTGAIIAFLDDDAEAEPDWLQRLKEEYVSSDVLGVGGSITASWMAGHPRWFPEQFGWVVGCTYRGMPETTAPVRNLIAANMSVRREAFQSLKGFRSGYGNVKSAQGAKKSLLRHHTGDEETEFCIRASQEWPNGKWMFAPLARVHHRVPASRRRWSYFVSRCFDEGLGKAVMARLVGARDGLSSERDYALRTLPKGIVESICDTAFKRDPYALTRAIAIVAGGGATLGGYLFGQVVFGVSAIRTSSRG